MEGQGSENTLKGNRWLRLMRAQKAWKAELFNMERSHPLFRQKADSRGDCSLFWDSSLKTALTSTLLAPCVSGPAPPKYLTNYTYSPEPTGQLSPPLALPSIYVFSKGKKMFSNLWMSECELHFWRACLSRHSDVLLMIFLHFWILQPNTSVSLKLLL